MRINVETTLLDRALACLARREHSRAELARKLASHAESADALTALLDDLESRRLLSDARYAEMRLRDLGYTRLARAAKKDSKLHTTLLGLGYGKEEIIVFKEF